MADWFQGHSHKEILRKLLRKNENKVCFDCKNCDNSWASANFGVVLCLDCAARHRNMGVHVSFVQSTTMDDWREDHLRALLIGGNSNARKFYRQHGFEALNTENIKARYAGHVGKRYKAMLQEKGNVREEVAGAIKALFPKDEAGEDEDFFAQDFSKTQSKEETEAAADARATERATAAAAAAAKKAEQAAAAAAEAAADEPAKSTAVMATTKAKPRVRMGAKKKGGLGAKKKMGARRMGAKKASAPVDWDNVDAKIEEAVVETPVEALNSMSLSAGGGVAGLAKVAAGGDKKTGRIGFGQTLGTGKPKGARDSRWSTGATETKAQDAGRFSNAKHISSDDFGGDGSGGMGADKYDAFSGAQSISSDAFYGGGPGGGGGY